MNRIDTRRDYNVSTDPRADLITRFRPSEENVLRAVARMADTGETELYTALSLPGKTRGIWMTGQVVINPIGLYPTRGEATLAAELALVEPGVAAYAVIYDDGGWAVFEA